MFSSPHVINIILQIITVSVNRLFRPDLTLGLHLDRLGLLFMLIMCFCYVSI